MNHCCEHECKHDQVKYCQGCKNVYCVSCKQKWEEPCTKAHSYPWNYTFLSNQTLPTPTITSISSDCQVHQ